MSKEESYINLSKLKMLRFQVFKKMFKDWNKKYLILIKITLLKSTISNLWSNNWMNLQRNKNPSMKTKSTNSQKRINLTKITFNFKCKNPKMFSLNLSNPKSTNSTKTKSVSKNKSNILLDNSKWLNKTSLCAKACTKPSNSNPLLPYNNKNKRSKS